MTREESKKAAEVMNAYADGKEIQYKHRDGDLWCEFVFGEPEFNWDRNEYRIKQEPTYRPFKNAKECWEEMQKHHPLGWVKGKKDGAYRAISLVNDDMLYKTSFESYTFSDGTPFGVKEE